MAETIREVSIRPSSAVAPSPPMSLYKETTPALRHPSTRPMTLVSEISVARSPCHRLIIDCFSHTWTCCARQSNAAGLDATHASCCESGTTLSRNSRRAGSSSLSRALAQYLAAALARTGSAT